MRITIAATVLVLALLPTAASAQRQYDGLAAGAEAEQYHERRRLTDVVNQLGLLEALGVRADILPMIDRFVPRVRVQDDVYVTGRRGLFRDRRRAVVVRTVEPAPPAVVRSTPRVPQPAGHVSQQVSPTRSEYRPLYQTPVAPQPVPQVTGRVTAQEVPIDEAAAKAELLPAPRPNRAAAVNEPTAKEGTLVLPDPRSAAPVRRVRGPREF